MNTGILSSCFLASVWASSLLPQLPPWETKTFETMSPSNCFLSTLFLLGIRSWQKPIKSPTKRKTNVNCCHLEGSHGPNALFRLMEENQVPICNVPVILRNFSESQRLCNCKTSFMEPSISLVRSNRFST